MGLVAPGVAVSRSSVPPSSSRISKPSASASEPLGSVNRSLPAPPAASLAGARARTTLMTASPAAADGLSMWWLCAPGDGPSAPAAARDAHQSSKSASDAKKKERAIVGSMAERRIGTGAEALG